jgi:hypothetical protein
LAHIFREKRSIIKKTFSEGSLPQWPLGSRIPQPRARGVGSGGRALQTRHALGSERLNDIAHCLFAAAHVAGNPRHPSPILAAQYDLAAPYAKGLGRAESSLQVLAFFGSHIPDKN